MFGNLGGWTAVIIILVIVLLFGATKIPALAKSLGQSAKIFKKEISKDDAEIDAESKAGNDSDLEK